MTTGNFCFYLQNRPIQPNPVVHYHLDHSINVFCKELVSFQRLHHTKLPFSNGAQWSQFRRKRQKAIRIETTFVDDATAEISGDKKKF
jgi:hypothetical protein